MFEKEADFAETKMLINCNGDYSKKKDYKKGWQDGAEFGYNKANEWHYVKDGDLPTKELEEKQLLIRVRNYTEDYIIAYYMLDKYYSKHGKRFYSDIDCDYPINIKNVIAWKEIIPPKEED